MKPAVYSEAGGARGATAQPALELRPLGGARARRAGPLGAAHLAGARLLPPFLFARVFRRPNLVSSPRKLFTLARVLSSSSVAFSLIHLSFCFLLFFRTRSFFSAGVLSLPLAFFLSGS